MNNPDQSEKAEITCRENGPYIFKNITRMVGKSGDAMDTKPTLVLCRCGQSSNKPFCDGSHKTAGYSGEPDLKNRTEDRLDTYAGKKITIHDNRGLCAHAGICTDNLSLVFRMKTRPWIDPDQASVEEIMSVIDKCPSGALSYSIDGVDQTQPGGATVKVLPNGPYEVTGDIEINDATPLQGASNRSRTLCRCGQSKNKPFCDGSHWAAGFKDN